MIVIGCNNKREGYDNLVGGWGHWGDTLLMISKQDTTVMGVLKSNIIDYANNEAVTYQNGSVLFKDIKILSDTTYTAKGLFLKPVYRTEEVFVRSFFTFVKDHYETRQVFDHIESDYVDYQLRISQNKQIDNITYVSLECIPFSEGPKWYFRGNISIKGARLLKEKRIADSTRVADSIHQVEKILEGQYR